MKNIKCQIFDIRCWICLDFWYICYTRSIFKAFLNFLKFSPITRYPDHLRFAQLYNVYFINDLERCTTWSRQAGRLIFQIFAEQYLIFNIWYFSMIFNLWQFQRCTTWSRQAGRLIYLQQRLENTVMLSGRWWWLWWSWWLWWLYDEDDDNDFMMILNDEYENYFKWSICRLVSYAISWLWGCWY